MLENYRLEEAKRAGLGIPALPLTVDQTISLCNLLENPPSGEEKFLLNLFIQRVAPGVDPAAKVKAQFLDDILKGIALGTSKIIRE